MKAWPFPRRAKASAADPRRQGLLDSSPALDLSRFDTFTHTDIAALPGRLRRQVIADRKRRVTAALARVATGAPRIWE